uniref:La-related protein 7 n=1 Tax=Schistosoma japonicum TaxID=6182 RepID=C1LEG7_SCHJA|nr:La-related protein 7 [Schistosoma japonicum]
MDLSEDLVPDDQSNFNKVLRQVEFYLSEGNLNRDRFFKQEMQKRDDNGIPIALLLKCNRMIAMNVNEDILKNVVEKSKILRLSDDGLAIVRVLPLSDFGPREKRTILVTELPRLLSGMTENVNENDTSQRSAKLCSNQMMDISSASCELTDWIRNMFDEYGEVLYVSLPRYHRSNSFRGFAFVEFKTSKSARKAVKHMFSVVDNEHWLVKPTETSEVSDCPESAWKPRLAAKVSFSQQQMLARRYIWRCCSRKNKQLIVAFKHLRQAGYTAGNPCDKEYYSIILGDSSTEAILKYVNDNRNCEPCQSKLRVFRYSDWVFWKQKFYLWQQAWIVRMHRKIDYLLNNNNNSINNNKDDANMDENDCCQIDSEMHKNSLPINCSNESSVKSKILPSNFVSNSIVQISWPSTLVFKGNTIDIPLADDICGTVIPPKKLSFARCLRISLEKNLLVPYNLLNDVAHVDPNPSQILLDSVNHFGGSLLPNTSVNESISSNEFIPLFIRMKNNKAAVKLVQSIELFNSHGATARILEGSSEQAYCNNIVNSKVNARERHRTSQIKKRQKQKSSNHHPVSLTNSLSSCKTDHKHIIFDE